MSRTKEFHLDQQHNRDLDHEEIDELDDAREHEREITSGFDDDQLTEGDPCYPAVDHRQKICSVPPIPGLSDPPM